MPGFPVRPQETSVVARLAVGILEGRECRALALDRQSKDQSYRLKQPAKLLQSQ